MSFRRYQHMPSQQALANQSYEHPSPPAHPSKENMPVLHPAGSGSPQHEHQQQQQRKHTPQQDPAAPHQSHTMELDPPPPRRGAALAQFSASQLPLTQLLGSAADEPVLMEEPEAVVIAKACMPRAGGGTVSAAARVVANDRGSSGGACLV